MPLLAVPHITPLYQLNLTSIAMVVNGTLSPVDSDVSAVLVDVNRFTIFFSGVMVDNSPVVKCSMGVVDTTLSLDGVGNGTVRRSTTYQ